MAPRPAVTPNDLSKDFVLVPPDSGTLDELGLTVDLFETQLDGPLSLNLYAAHFMRDEAGVIKLVGVGDDGTLVSIAACSDVTLAGLAAGDILRWVPTVGEVLGHWENTDDLSAANIKTLYESNANTNAFTDALLTKLNGIEAGAQVNQSFVTIIAGIDAALAQTAWRQPSSFVTRIANRLLDASDFVRERVTGMSVAGANTVTVPSGLTVIERATVIQTGVGVTTIVAGAGVTFIAAENAHKFHFQGSSAQIIPTDIPDTYVIIGDLIP